MSELVINSDNSYRDGRYNYIYIYPYGGGSDFKEIIAKYGIALPDLVDMSMGRSVCKSCGAVYQGTQVTCTRMVEKHRISYYNSRHGYSWERGVTNMVDTCEGYLDWNLRQQFDEQKSLFELISMIKNIGGQTNDLFDKHADKFPEGVAANLKIRYMANRIDHLEFSHQQIIGAIKQIAEKMNAAGNALHFGF